MRKTPHVILLLCSLFLLSSCGFTRKKEVAQKELEIESLTKELKSKEDDDHQFNDKLKKAETQRDNYKEKMKQLEKENRDLKSSGLLSTNTELHVIESSGQYGKEIYQAITGKNDKDITNSKKAKLSEYQGKKIEGTVGWHTTIGPAEETETHYIVYEAGDVKIAMVYILDQQQIINQGMVVEIDNEGQAKLLSETNLN
ncbi:hypothetical protein [Vagococcus sp.]|uniref:hypothetical protein n=1 Tax=Vagococcus sp. TaxID=1933889 RepID=UPI003F9CF759